MTGRELLVIAVLAVLAFWTLGAYNRLVRLRQSVAVAFAQIDVHFRQRHDLLGELIEACADALADAPDAVAGLDAARRQTRVAADRAALRPASAGRLASLALAEQVLRTASLRLITLVKARPAMRSDPRLRAVTQSLSTAQHRVSAAREGFNATVLDYNRNVQQFPTRLIAGMLGFRVAGTL